MSHGQFKAALKRALKQHFAKPQDLTQCSTLALCIVHKLTRLLLRMRLLALYGVVGFASRSSHAAHFEFETSDWAFHSIAHCTLLCFAISRSRSARCSPDLSPNSREMLRCLVWNSIALSN
jgi:hypothetical protein